MHMVLATPTRNLRWALTMARKDKISPSEGPLANAAALASLSAAALPAHSKSSPASAASHCDRCARFFFNFGDVGAAVLPP